MKSLKFYLIAVALTCGGLSVAEAQNVGINSTGNAPDSKHLLEVLQPSTTDNSVGIYVKHSGADATKTLYGLQAIRDGAGLVNIAAYLQAINGTSNYALIVPPGGGNVGIGTTAPLSRLNIVDTLDGTSSLTSYAATLNLGATSNSANGFNAGRSELITLSSSTANYTTPMTAHHTKIFHNGTGILTETRGITGVIRLKSTGTISLALAGNFTNYNDAAGTMTNVHGVFNQNGNLSTGIITNSYGFYTTLLNSGGGTITNTYGMYIGDLTEGTQTNTPFSIYSSDASTFNYFAGNVGIGTTSPNALLELRQTAAGTLTAPFLLTNLSNSANTEVELRFAPSNSATTRYSSISSINDGSNNTDLKFSTGSGGTLTERIRIMALTGNVGIGTNSPNKKLDVEGNATDIVIQLSNTGTSGRPWNFISSSSGSLNPAGSFGIQDETAGSTRFLINNTGNVGIGTINPLMHFQVGNGLGLSWGNNNVLQMNQYYDNTDTRYESLGSGYSFMLWQDKTTGIVRFGMNNNNATAANEAVAHNYALNILPSGNVGVNTITPKGALSVVRASLTDGLINLADNETDATNKYATIVLRHYTNAEEPVLLIGGQSFSGTSDVLIGGNFSTANAATSIKFYTAANNTTTSGTVRATIDGNGNVGIGIVSTSAQLHTTGTVRFANFGAGTMQTDASGNVSVSSDERLKKIKGDFTKGLDAVLRLTPKTYKWNKLSGLDEKEEYTGFIAQNVQQFIPEAVNIDNRGFLTLSDRPIIATLVNATKELNQKIQEQQHIIASLKAENEQKINRTEFDNLKAEFEQFKAFMEQSSKK